MISKNHNHTSQPNPRHHKEKPQNTNSHNASGRPSEAASTLFPIRHSVSGLGRRRNIKRNHNYVSCDPFTGSGKGSRDLLTCAYPENVVRGGPTLTIFFG